MSRPLVLVTGATGYIGSRLVPRLLNKGYRVRCLVREGRRLTGRSWVDDVDVVEGDVLRPETLPSAMDDVTVATYLIHSMNDTAEFHRRDTTAARNFAAAAQDAGVGRIIYLGGLGEQGTALSEHLRSRQETGQALREPGVPVTEFRAAIVVGSGSFSFEMIRYLTERLPVMVCPRWVYTRVQPICIRNVLDYLAAAIDRPDVIDGIVEIGGQDVVTYGDMMRIYAETRGLRRTLLPVPVLTPRLSSYWVHWMTPIPAEIAKPLVEGLRNEVIVRDERARRLFPDIVPMGYRASVSRALERIESGDLESWWSDSLSVSQGDVPPVLLTTRDGMIVEQRVRSIDTSVDRVFRTVCGIGGRRGWFYANWAWWFRGRLDRLVGGVGLRRGRRDPDHLRVGDALDFWRVEDVQENERVRLRAEMKVPGRAWLEFECAPRSDPETSILSQRAYFAPKGLSGLLYWYALYPIHKVIFTGMIDAIAERCLAEGDER